MGRHELRRRIIGMLLEKGFKLRRSELLRAPVDRICDIVWVDGKPRLTKLRFDTVEMLVKRGWDLTDMPVPDEKGKMPPDPLAAAVDETCHIVCEGVPDEDLPEDPGKPDLTAMLAAIATGLEKLAHPLIVTEEIEAKEPETPKVASSEKAKK